MRKEKYSKFNYRAPADCPAWLLAEYRAWYVILRVHLRDTVSSAANQLLQTIRAFRRWEWSAEALRARLI